MRRSTISSLLSAGASELSQSAARSARLASGRNPSSLSGMLLPNSAADSRAPSRLCIGLRAARRGGAVLAASAALVAGVSACKKASLPSPSAGAAASAPAAPPPAAPTAPSGAVTTALPEAVRKVLGHWLRGDGGYVLELRRAEMSGVIEAYYFNPKSINVSRAIWMQGSTGLQVVVELTDVGYPGATYMLSYDAAADRLAGKYTQPQMQQTFDIEFVRQPKP